MHKLVRLVHHASMVVAILVGFSFSISESSVIFGTIDLTFVFTTTGRCHFHMGLVRHSPRK